jgi:hypothetical protein
MHRLLADRQDASPTVLTLHKREVLRQLDRRLGRPRYEESLRTGPVTQLQLEEELNRVWGLIRPRPTHKVTSPFQNNATWLGLQFDQGQMKAVAVLLVELTQHVPWRFDYAAWWEAVRKVADAERLARAAAAPDHG